MQVPNYNAQYLPTANAGTAKSLGGEKSSAMRIPNTEAAKWSALKQTSDSLFDMSTKISQAQDAAEYNNAIVTLKEGYASIKNDLKTNAKYNEFSVEEYENRNNELSTSLQSAVLGNMKSTKAKKQASLAAREMGIGSRTVAQSVGYNKFIDRERANSLNNLETLSNSFIDTGNMKDLAYAEGILESSVEAGFFSEQEGVAIATKFKDNAISGYYENVMTKDPIGMYNDIIRDKNEPQEWSQLSSEYKTNLTKKLKTLYNQKNDELRVDAVGTWQNMSIDKPVDTWNQFKAIPKTRFNAIFNDLEYAQLKKSLKSANDAYLRSTTGDSIDPVLKGRLDRGLKDAISKVENIGLQPSGVEEAIMDVYGNSAKTRRKGQAILEQYEAESQLAFGKYAVKKDIQNGDIKANSEYLVKIKPTEGSKDFDNRQIIYDSAVKEFNKKVDKLSTDPKDLFDSYFPQKRPTSADPAQRIKENKVYMQEMTDWYVKQGLPKQMWKVMTKEEAKVYSDTISEKAPKDIINDVIAIQDMYGANANIAFRDLSAEGFPTPLRIIADLPKSSLNTTGIDLANAYKLKESDFAGAMGEASKDTILDINSRINSNSDIQDYQNSVYTTGTTSNNIKVVSDVKNALRKLSYVYMMRGDNSNQAVKKAVGAVLGNKFTYIDNDNNKNMSIRIDSSYDEKTISNLINNKLDNISINDLSSNYIDKTLTGKTKELAEKRFIRTITRSAYWKNAGGDKDKLILVDVNNVPLFGSDEKPITIDITKYK